MKFAQNNHPTRLFGSSLLFGTWEYRTRAIITRGLYTFTQSNITKYLLLGAN